MARRAPLSVPVVEPPPPIAEPSAKKPSSRDGKRNLVIWVDAANYLAFSIATKQLGTTMQAAGLAMFEAWCRQHAVKLPSQ